MVLYMFLFRREAVESMCLQRYVVNNFCLRPAFLKLKIDMFILTKKYFVSSRLGKYSKNISDLSLRNRYKHIHQMK